MKPKWNISILVIFILLASSLLGVLAMNFVQSMIKQSATVYNYYQSYYLAKAGTELALSEIWYRGIWFEQTFFSSGFVVENFRCGWRCSFAYSLSWMTNVLSQQFWTSTWCQTPFVLSKWESFILPLFFDAFVGPLSEAFVSPISYANLYEHLLNSTLVTSDLYEVTFGMLVLSGWDLASNWFFFQTGSLKTWLPWFLSAFDGYFRSALWISNLTNTYITPYTLYFLISNARDQEISFCLQSTQPLPTQQYYIKSQWTYDHQTLWLEALYKQPIPDFLLNGYLRF